MDERMRAALLRAQRAEAEEKQCSEPKPTTVVFPAGSSHLCLFRSGKHHLVLNAHLCRLSRVRCPGTVLLPQPIPEDCPLRRGPVVVELGETGSGE